MNLHSLRVWLGRTRASVRAWWGWYAPGVTYTSTIQSDAFAHVSAAHRTPLFRQLPGVDHRLQENKVVNIGLAIKKIHGTVLRPGETFSFWRCVGAPTAQKGYLEGMVLNQGRVERGIGGGLCQLTALLYWMTLHTPLTVIERWRHGYDIFPDVNRTQPFGSGATCFYPFLDLKIKNTTAQPFHLSLALTNTELVGCWTAPHAEDYRYQIIEEGARFVAEWNGGYTRHNQLVQEVRTPSGLLVRRSVVATNVARTMYDPFLPAETA